MPLLLHTLLPDHCGSTVSSQSPLASSLLGLEGVTGVFLGADFITISKVGFSQSVRRLAPCFFPGGAFFITFFFNGGEEQLTTETDQGSKHENHDDCTYVESFAGCPCGVCEDTLVQRSTTQTQSYYTCTGLFPTRTYLSAGVSPHCSSVAPPLPPPHFFLAFF